MKVAQQQIVKIPSKSQFLARIGEYAPSNLKKTSNGFDSTMTSTAYRTFSNPSTNKESPGLALKKDRSASAKETAKSARPTAVTKGQEKKKRAASAKAKTGPKRQKTSAASSSVNSLGSEAAVPSQNQLASGEEEEISENESNHQRKSKSVSNQKPNLPGNYEAPSYLFKGIFQNNYMIGDTIQVKDQDYDRVAYQKGYKDYEQEYKLHQEAKGQENFNDTNYLDKKLALYKLIDDENLEATQKNRKLISLTDTINGSQALVNPNYMPESVPFERLPGYIQGKRTISERERAAMFIQRVMRGILTRQRIKKVKENLKKHLKGDLDADPYEIEFYDLNVPAFKKLIEFQEGPIKPTKSSAKLAEEYDPEKKLLTNTFYSVIRSPFFPEDPMDYYVLGETKDDQFAAFPKLIYEDQQRRTKDIMLERKYNYLFEKPLMKDYKTDENSVIKSFLKSNLAAITTADLKVDKFKIEYKSPVKAKTKPVLSFSAKSPRSAEPSKPKRFGQMTSGTKDEIQSEISEDYGDDFEQDSAIKESIQESYDMKNSVIKESIPYSDSKNKSMINESIQESLEQSSPPMGKISKRMSNKSISEDIEVTNSRRYDRNASFKSIEEEIPGSESTSPRYKKSQLKKVKSMEDEIEEDIPAKDSYGDEGFESLDESIQESIEKFQNSRSNSKMDKLNLKEVSTPSPQKKVDAPSKPSFVSSKPALFKPKEEKKEEKIAPLSKTMPAAVQKQKPMEATTTIPITRPLSSTMAAPKYEERVPMEYAGYDEEPRRLFARTEFATGSATKTAEVLFANFQKELEKMVYVDNLSQKVHTLESTLENIYNQKEYNILNALQNKISGAPGSSFQPHSALTPSELEGNSLVYLMKKYNTLERSMGAISNQLNFLINNFTGGAPVAGQSFPAAGATGLKVTGKRKPRPIIPVRRAQNVRIKDEATLKPAAQQVQAVQEKENVVVKQKEQKEVIKPKEVSPVKQQQVKEAPKELPKPVSIKEDKPKPKFQFKFNEPQIKDKEDDEVAEEIITEEDVPELPVNVPANPVNVVKAEEKPKPAAVQETKKLPDLSKPVGAAALQKSAKFGKWHESSSEEVIEDADSKRKTPEEEDFSVKEYSDTSDRPAARVLPSAVPKAEEKKKEITMPLTLPSNLQTKKPIQDESESIIDEIMDIPIEDIDEPASNRNAKGKEAKKEKADDDDYYDDEFEELSYHSEPKEEKPAPVLQKSPKVEKRVVPEVSPIPEKSISSDVEASQDLSIISWQEIVAPADAKKTKEAKDTKTQEKKVEDVTNLVMQSILQDLSKDLFPKRNFAQIEEVKSKLKHVNIAEQQIFNVHQETPEMAQVAAEKLNQSQVKEEDVKHNKYTDNIKKELNVLTSKMSQAKKSQIIAITINHINFSDPATKFSIFDKNPVKDESITDAYNEIFLKLFRSEFRKLNNEFATTKDVEKTMMIKMDNLINKSKDILIKKIGQVHSETEESQKFGRNFNDMYETMRHKKMVGEENDFFEEEEDIKRLMEEENNKVKESVADQVMETLFEEAVQELVGLKKSRGNMRRY